MINSARKQYQIKQKYSKIDNGFNRRRKDKYSKRSKINTSKDEQDDYNQGIIFIYKRIIEMPMIDLSATFGSRNLASIAKNKRGHDTSPEVRRYSPGTVHRSTK